jgi:hypothetical protein
LKINYKKSLLVGVALAGFFLLPKFSEAATLNLSPSGGSFSVGATISVSVRTNTQNQAVNTSEVNITYSTDTLELVRVSQGSTFYLPAPGSPAKGTGTAYFGGGLPNPGYTGSGGSLGTLTFRAKATGNASVTIANGKVLLNDGSGTDALTGVTNARFTIIPPPVGSVTVSSATHPDPTKWYNAATVNLSWDRPNAAYGYSFELDQSKDTVPDDTLETTITTTKSYPDLKDGTWYFHIRARATSASAGFGATTHFAINVDTAAPNPFEVKLVGETNLQDVGTTPTVSFEATDTPSGVDYYSVDVDGKNVSPKTTSPYTLAMLTGGPHVVRVTALDKAGNSRVAELPIIISGPAVLGFFQRNLSLPLYLLFAMNFLILLLMIVVVWLLLKRRDRRNYSGSPVASLQVEIDDTLDKLRQDIDRKLLSLTSKSSDELYEKEAKVSKAITSDIAKTRKKIDGKIGRAQRKG